MMHKRIHTILSFLVVLALLSAGCTLDNITDTSSDPVTEADLVAATQILGEALSGANSGVMLSMSDALAILAQSNINTNVAYSMVPKGPTIQDHEQNYMHVYDPDTGTHMVSFLRESENPFLSKSVTDTLKYIYRDSDSNFIEYPREQGDRIASLYYTGLRQGSLSTLHKESSFTRQDTFLVAGYDDNTSELSIEGMHQSTGSISIDQPERGSIEHSYKLTIPLLDINIGKDILDDSQQVATTVTGSLSWEIQFGGPAAGGAHLRGTIELNGDGTALLRFRSSPDLFQVNLISGEVINLDEAFEGRVSSVDVSAQRLTLVSGQNIYFSENAAIEGTPFVSLQAVQEALNNSIPIRAKGEGSFQNNQFNSTKVAFERENADVNNELRIAFEEPVTSANPDTGIFTVAGEAAVRVGDQTIIDDLGDYHSLQQVMEALNKKESITAKGEVILPADTLNQVTATNVTFNKSN